MRWARFFGIGFAAILLVVGVARASDANQECLSCHGDPGMRETKFQFANKSSVVVFVDGGALGRSVHGDLDCVDCHQAFRDDHPSRAFRSRGHYLADTTRVCLDCHDLGPLHKRLLSEQKQLNCVDCHGSHAVQPVDRNGETCVGCHDKGIRVALADGSQAPPFNQESLAKSVHQKLRCVDCHFGFSSGSHPERRLADARDFSLAHAETCRRCHFDKYTMSLESVHTQVLREDRTAAPVCTDCHGSHAVQSGRHDKLAAARRCRNCHSDIYDVYVNSVHGKALVSADNQDVPVCSDCHTAHKIRDPEQTDFRNNIPQMCADCHANGELMARYNLSTSVLNSYLEDFHGVTLSYYKKEESGGKIAVCTDCHGIHDIASLRARDSAAVKETLLARCRRCHEQAAGNFPDAWISHYEPTFRRAPLVYSVSVFYRFFIPFMVVGLVLQIGLHIWRYASNR